MSEAVQMSLFENPFLLYLLLPFLLVFVLVYAILEKTNILGEGKRYANIIIAMVIAFLFIAVPAVVGVTIKIIPIVSLILVILLCLLLMFGFVGIEIEKNRGLKITLGILLGLAILGILSWSTGVLKYLKFSSVVWQYVIFFLIFGGAIALIVSTSGSGGRKEEK